MAAVIPLTGYMCEFSEASVTFLFTCKYVVTLKIEVRFPEL